MTTTQASGPTSLALELHAQHVARRRRFNLARVEQNEQAPAAIAQAVVEEQAQQKREAAKQLREAALLELQRQAAETIAPVKHGWRLIVASVCEAHNVSFGSLRADYRRHDILFARHEAFYRLAADTPMSLPAIGRVMGGKDHTTVLNGIRQHAARNNLPLPRASAPSKPSRPVCPVCGR